MLPESLHHTVAFWNQRAARICANGGAERAKKMWETGWEDRLLAAARSRGFDNLTAFLEKSPAVPYADLASNLGVAPIQLVILQLAEVTTPNQQRRAAADMLARELNAYLPGGWGISDSATSKCASAYAAWASAFRRKGEKISPETFKPNPVLWGVFNELKNLNPQTGWKPCGEQMIP